MQTNTATQLETLFAGIDDVQFGSQRLPYIEANAHYELKILKTQMFQTRKKTWAFIAEFEILKTSSATQAVGSKVSFYLPQGTETFNKNVSVLAHAALGLDYSDPADFKKIAEEVQPQMQKLLAEACDQNLWAGAKVTCQTNVRKSIKTGKDYVAYNWGPLKG